VYVCDCMSHLSRLSPLLLKIMFITRDDSAQATRFSLTERGDDMIYMYCWTKIELDSINSCLLLNHVTKNAPLCVQ
jgi:hypothetical protein